jgi:hypothetical protein
MLSDGHLEIKSFNFVPAFNVGAPHTPLFEAPQAAYADFLGPRKATEPGIQRMPKDQIVQG